MQRHCTLKEREEAHTDTERILCLNFLVLGLPWWLSSKERICLPMQEIWVQSLGQEDPLGEGNDSLLQYSCLGNPMDRGAW